MAILDLEIVLRPDELLAPGLAGDLAERCGEVLDSPPGNTWVKLHSVPREHYAENGGGPPEGVYPVFVSVLKARLPAPEALSTEVARLTAAVARGTGRSAEHVHVVYLPAGGGRVAFGGKVLPAA
jgi:phenylpyruvate tautomerase PptA (4-oxalocrotonate tautomerase family)